MSGSHRRFQKLGLRERSLERDLKNKEKAHTGRSKRKGKWEAPPQKKGEQKKKTPERDPQTEIICTCGGEEDKSWKEAEFTGKKGTHVKKIQVF